MNNNIIYYTALFGLFTGFRWAYSVADNNDVYWLVAPTSRLVSWLTGETAVYDSAIGFGYSGLNIVIEKLCSGFNFWLLSASMLIYRGLRHYNRPLQKAFLFPFGAVFCYFLTILANTSRILTAIKTNTFCPAWQKSYPWLHELQGSIIYLSCLIGLYLLLDFWWRKPEITP